MGVGQQNGGISYLAGDDKRLHSDRKANCYPTCASVLTDKNGAEGKEKKSSLVGEPTSAADSSRPRARRAAMTLAGVLLPDRAGMSSQRGQWLYLIKLCGSDNSVSSYLMGTN